MRKSRMKVLLIADDSAQARRVAALLETAGLPEIALDYAGGLPAASERLSAHSPDVILLDLALPEAPGLDGLLRVSAESSAPIVVLAGDRQRDLAERALRHGAHAHLQKDQLDAASLLRALDCASAPRLRALGHSAGLSGDVQEAEGLARVLSTERTRTREALRRSESSFRALIERSPYGVLRADLDGTIVGANQALAAMLGYASPTQLIGLRLSDLYRQPAECRSIADQARCGPTDAERQWKRQDGTPVAVRYEWCSADGTPGEVLLYEAIVEDITERLTLERKLRQALKMEAAGRLAGGLAHDFNNMLGVIIGYSDMLIDQVTPADPLRGQLEEIRKAGDRAASLARQFLAFTREESPEQRVLNLNTVVTDLECMLRRLIREDIELHTFLAPALGQIKSDQGQIEQVIINLAVNARDAMPQGGKLILETFNVDLNEVYALHHPPLVPGPYVCLAVADTGVGMSAETQAHIFEPFFTTKPKGHGTGLGLATVFGVVKQNNGYVWVYSEPGVGATFKVYLPRVGDLAERSSGPRQAGTLPRRSETILLVEDEPALRTVTGAMLQRGGYSVLEAANAAEALAVAEGHAGQIDLLLTDVIMPGMNGPALAAKLARTRPQMRVLFISGYTGSYVAHRGLIEESSLLLQKPFTSEALLRKLHEILDSPRPADVAVEAESHRE
jgi:two-component system cell cycle sensor histidine kinase/response regulator CckA